MTGRDKLRERADAIAVRLLESDPERWAPILMPRGSARQAAWPCEDGWEVRYTTERVDGGPYAGRFAVLLYRVQGPGARTGRYTAETEWRLVYERAFSTRKAAKARAVKLYRAHSPKWDARHPERASAPAHDPEATEPEPDLD